MNLFELVDCPPYEPKLAPIEFVFYELAVALSRRCNRDWTIGDLCPNVIDIVRYIGRGGRLHSTFIHCGYPF